jgi:hypothetical protein
MCDIAHVKATKNSNFLLKIIVTTYKEMSLWKKNHCNYEKIIVSIYEKKLSYLFVILTVFIKTKFIVY